MTHNDLVMLQALPLEIKIAKTELRIIEWIEHFGLDKVHVSFSGGKDSTVLAHICRRLYPDIKMVFCNTGQEYPETISFVMKMKKEGWNIDIVRPKMKFKEVLEKYGYPVISKEVSMSISRWRLTKREDQKEYRMFGKIKDGIRLKSGTIPKKYHDIAVQNKFKISEKCCDVLKKNPIKKYEKETGRVSIVGTMAHESSLRKQYYLKQGGCNSFDSKKKRSAPIGFWLEQDIWDYIKFNNLEISECYTKHNMKRTGCYGCLFGCHLEEKATSTNRIVKLEESHPKLYKHLIKDLGYDVVMKELNLKF